MADLQYTPVTLWQDFDKTDAETEVSVIRVKRGGYLTTRPLYFTGSQKGLQIYARLSDRPPKTRVYAEYCRLSKKAPDKSMPAILIINEPGNGIDGYLMRKMAKEGYAVLSIDLDGGTEPDNLQCTVYSSEVPYAVYETAKADGFAFNDPRLSCFYEWAAITMRAITVLSAFPEVDPGKVGVIASGKAADISAMAGYKDERINRMAVLFGDPNAYVYSDPYMQTQYTAALSVKAYAQHIKCPVLYMAGSNESSFDVSDACEVFGRIPQNTGSSCSIMERADHEVPFEYAGNLKSWFGLMKAGLPPPVRPLMSYRISENKFYAVLDISPPDTAEAVKMFLSYGDAPNFRRNWTEKKLQEVGSGEYIAEVKPFDKLHVCAFSRVVYPNGLCLSARMSCKNPGELGLPLMRPERYRLIYSADNGTDCFTTIDNKTPFHRSPNVIMREGPLELTGVSNSIGNLATYKTGSELHSGGDGEALIIDMSATKPSDTEIVIRNTAGEEYIYKTRLDNKRWQKLQLEAKKFKNTGNMPLQSYKNAAMIYFRAVNSNAHVLISSMLWT